MHASIIPTNEIRSLKRSALLERIDPRENVYASSRKSSRRLI
jgi:hypothetical protein